MYGRDERYNVVACMIVSHNFLLGLLDMNRFESFFLTRIWLHF